MRRTITKHAFVVIAVMAAFMAVLLPPIPQASADEGSRDMYRLYNPNSGEHFYTADSNERDHLTGVGWVYEVLVGAHRFNRLFRCTVCITPMPVTTITR